MLTIFLVNANTHWAYKDCQFINCILVKIAGSFLLVPWFMVHVYTYAKFHVHINAKSVNQFLAGKRNFTPPSFGKECKRGNAVKMLL